MTDLAQNCEIALWNKIHEEATWLSDGNYPSPNARAFAQYHLPSVTKSSKVSLLDLGCGTGATTVFFSALGYCVSGLDASAIALEKANERAKKNGAQIKFERGDFRALPFPADHFDAVFSEGVLYYGKRSDFENGVKEIYRILKPGGVARIYTKTDRDVWTSEGTPIGENTFRVVTKTWEQGLLIYCAPLKEIREFFYCFKKLKIGIEEFNYVDTDRIHSFWVITCEKP